MIEYGKNGKMKGTWLAGEFLYGGYVFFLPRDIRYHLYSHKIRDIQFSEQVKTKPELAAHFSSCVHELLKLLNYAEREKKLFLQKEKMSPKLREALFDEDLTGMTAVLFFQKHFLEISEESDFFLSIEAAEILYDGIPNPEEYVRCLLRTILNFSGEDTGNIRIEVFRKKEENDGPLSVSYDTGELREALTEKEENVRKNQRAALQKIRESILKMENQKTKGENDE